MTARTLASLTDPALRAALAEAMIRTGDDELIIGHRHSEWTGFGVDLESDIAFSSIAQEEIGHARLFYGLAHELGSPDPDRLAFGRRPGEYRNATLCEQENGDWSVSIARLALYEIADQARLEAFARSPVPPLAGLARTLAREESYHRFFAETWLARLANAGGDARRRAQDAIDLLAAPARGLFEPTDADDALVAAGLLDEPPEALRDAWEARVAAALEPLGLRLAAGAAPAPGGRRGLHTPALAALWDDMTSVWRSDPGATW